MARTSFLDKFHPERALAERQGLPAVMRSVQAMLSTKRDYGYFLRDFGLGKYAEKTSKAGLAVELAKEMQAELRKHEPRLEDVKVKLKGRDSALWLHFDLSASLSGEACHMRILFDTTTGQVQVEPKEVE